MSHAFPLPAVPMKPRPPMSQRPTARYSYQTATTGMSSPTPSGDSFWGGVSRGIKEKGGMDGVEEGNESVRTVMTTPNTSPHKLEQETVQESEVTPATSTSSPPTMTTDFRALRVQHFERLSHSTNKEATNIDDLPVSATHLDLSFPVIPPRLRKRSAISTDISTAPSSPPYNSLQRGVPSPSVGVLAGSNIVLDRINRLRDVASPSMSSGKRSSPSRRVSGTHSRKSSLGDRAELTPSSSNNTTTTSTTPRRIRPPRLDTIITPKPPSPTLQRVETTSSAKKMIGMFESLPNTPAAGARKALQDISEGRGGSIPSSTTLPYRRSYLASKSLPPIDTVSNSLFPPVLQSTATERHEAPTLLSAWSPHGKMPIRDNGTTARPISIPNSPTTGMKSSPSKSMMSRSPLSKSPLREIIGAFAHVKAKMGNKKGNEEEDARGRVMKGRKRSETVSSWSGGVISRHGVGGAMAIDAGPVRVEIKPAGYPIKEGQLMYLVPTPCSSLSPWGAWVSGRGALYSNVLELDHQDETGRPTTIDFLKCDGIRSVKDGEIASRGIPAPGVAAVIELEFEDRSRLYLAAVDFLERSGWISAMLDAKADVRFPASAPRRMQFDPVDPMSGSQLDGSNVPAYVPVRQRLAQLKQQHSANSSPYSRNQPSPSPVLPTAPLQIRNRTPSYPLQPKRTPFPQRETDGDLRGSVTRLFTVGPNGSPVAQPDGQVLDWVKATKADSVTGERKEEWVGAERDLSVFGPAPSRGQSEDQRQNSSEHPVGDHGANHSLERAPTVLSFDMNDLNPSRSASQVAPRVHPVEIDNKTTLLDFPQPVPTPRILQEDEATSSMSTALPVRRQLPAVPPTGPSDGDTLPVLKVDGRSGEVTRSVLGTPGDSGSQTEAETILNRLEETVKAIHMDVKGVRDLSSPSMDLSAVERRLDEILLVVKGIPSTSHGQNDDPMQATDEAAAAKEVSDIMSGKSTSGLPIGLDPEGLSTSETDVVKPDDIVTQISQVLDTVKDLQASRASQDQNSSDIGQHLFKMNGWLESFVNHGTTELQTLSGRLDRLVSEIAPAQTGDDAQQGAPPASLPALVQQMHGLMMEQKERESAEAIATQRVDALIGALTQNRESQERQQAAMEGVMSLIERQRQEHETLLRALATDLTSEIRGERLRFVEAMREATNINVHMHVEQFKKTLAQEIAQHSQELAQLREQRKGLEMVISDLFAIKAKHASEPAVAPPSPANRLVQVSSPGVASSVRGPPPPPAPRPLPLPHH